MDGDGDLPAGQLGPWLDATRRSAAGEADADVPCDGCTACCRASYFVHIEPDEVDTLRRIPAALRFPAPGRPKGHVLLGYDERGHCPMLVDDRCSIYEDRPRTCRAFDCRVFPAAGLSPEGAHEVEIAQRARRWRFDLTAADDLARAEAVQDAARFLTDHAGELEGLVPHRAGDLAVAAIRVHEHFLGGEQPTPDAVAASLRP